MDSDDKQNSNQSFATELARNLVAGLAVSFVAISLGAAFGILSGRGAFAGILSAGIIALITGLFGGTRVQTSGPTAPMTAVTVLIIAFAMSSGPYAQNGLLEAVPGADTVRFVNLVFFLTAILLLIAAVCRLGRFIQIVPKTVISGFMNGIAILIWVDQAKKLFGLAGQTAYEGPIATNCVVALSAFLIAFFFPMLAKRVMGRFSSFLPGTLVSILIVTVMVQVATMYRQPDSMQALTIPLEPAEEAAALLEKIESPRDFVEIAKDRIKKDGGNAEDPVPLTLLRGRPHPELGATTELFSLDEGQWTAEPHQNGEDLFLVLVQSKSTGGPLDIQMTKTEKVENTVAAWTAVVQRNLPTDWDPELLMLALPFAFQLMMLCYLDTLLTSLVMDKKATEMFGREERTKQNQELASQGVATAVIAMVGGIPGAQATIRSVLILNEGATWRLASASVGVFVLIEMLIFQDKIGLIPVAVFTGILFKVGYDVFDWGPVVVYGRRLLGQPAPVGTMNVSHLDLFFIAGTTIVTLVRDLNTAVFLFTILFYLVRLRVNVPDLAPAGLTQEKDESITSG